MALYSNNQSMYLIHWSKEPIEQVVPNSQTEHSYKPNGLWISDEKDYGWKQWCEDNNYPCGTIAYSINFIPNHKILILRNLNDLKEFTYTYGYSYYGSSRIDWVAVAKKYHGILITPYQSVNYSCEEYQWYYGWDCASGCVWNPVSIQILPLVPTPKATQILA